MPPARSWALRTSPGVQHAAFWTNSSSAPVDLGTLGGTASQADAINTAGQIVGYADTAGVPNMRLFGPAQQHGS